MNLSLLLQAQRRRRGGLLVEYTVLLSLLGAVALGVVVVLGDRTRGVLEDTRDTLTGDRPAPGTPPGEPPQGILPGQIAWSGDGRFVLSPGQPSETRLFTLTNTGFGRSLPFGSPEVRGPGVGVFEIMASDCPDSLGSGEACQVMLRASAAGNGAWAARLEADGVPGGVPLSAEAAGFAPAFAWSGDGLFALDGASATPAAAERTFALSNIGTLRGAPAPVVVSGAGFSLVSTTCGPALEIGETCQATVRATAADNGPLSGQLASGDALLPLLGAASGFAAQLTWEGSPVFEIAGPAATPAALERTFSLRNDGTLAATGLAVAFSGDTSGPVAFSLLSTTCGSTLGVGERCDAVVRLTATADGAATALLSSGGAMPAETSLVGEASGIAPALVWSGPASVSLDGTPPQALPVSGQTTVTLLNTGNQDAAGLGALTVSGAGWSLLGTTCGPTLAQGAACTATLALEAATNGTFPGLLAGAGRPDLPLAGSATGFAPAFAWSGGDAFVLTAPASNPDTVERTFTLTNVGTLAGAPDVPAVSGDGAGYAFSLASTTCGPALAVGGSCTATVRATFTDNVASATGTLGGPATQPLTGSATGFAPAWAWSGGSAFTLTAPASNPALVERTFTLTNVGTLAGTPATPTVSGSGAGFAYSLVSHTCGASIAVGATCQAVVRATYTDNVTSATGTLGGPATQPLTGSATGFAPAWAWSGGSAFTLTAPASNPALVERTFTLTNVGTLAGTPATPTVSGSGAGFAYSLVSHTCGASIAVGATCQAVVRATYTDNVASATGTLGGPTTQPLTGSASGFAAAWAFDGTPSGVFAIAAPATTSSQTFTLRNTGTLAAAPPARSISGAAAARYTITGGSCSATAMAPGETCTVAVTFSANSNLTGQTASLTAGAASRALSGSASGFALPTWRFVARANTMPDCTTTTSQGEVNLIGATVVCTTPTPGQFPPGGSSFSIGHNTGISCPTVGATCYRVEGNCSFGIQFRDAFRCQ